MCNKKMAVRNVESPRKKKKKNIAEMMAITGKFSKIIKFILYGHGRSMSILKQY